MGKIVIALGVFFLVFTGCLEEKSLVIERNDIRIELREKSNLYEIVLFDREDHFAVITVLKDGGDADGKTRTASFNDAVFCMEMDTRSIVF